MTRKLPVDAGWTIVRREGQGISSVPGAKWLIKPGEIQLGAFNTYRARRVGSMRTGATRRVADDTLRFLEVQAMLVIARTYRDLSVTRRTFEGKRSGLSRSGLVRQTNKLVLRYCVRDVRNTRAEFRESNGDTDRYRKQGIVW